ncbi:MAG: hypothetical protein ACREEM_03235 [Blastocatellia bacterium]
MNHTFSVTEGDCDLTDELPAELDFTNLKPDWAQTEKRRALARARMIQLDADLAAIFPDSLAVNAALRELLARRQSESAGAFMGR